jgi:hypothetical protein
VIRFSVSFAGLGFLSYYLAGKLHLFDERGHTVRNMGRCEYLGLTFILSVGQGLACIGTFDWCFIGCNFGEFPAYILLQGSVLIG